MSSLNTIFGQHLGHALSSPHRDWFGTDSTEAEKGHRLLVELVCGDLAVGRDQEGSTSQREKLNAGFTVVGLHPYSTPGKGNHGEDVLCLVGNPSVEDKLPLTSTRDSECRVDVELPERSK